MRFVSAACLMASALTAQTLTTTFAGGLGQNGNMFDITAINPVVISSFDINISAGGPWTVEVYTVTGGGTFVGRESDAAAWTLVGSASVTSAGINQPTAVYLPIDTPIAAGGRQGFYVTTTGATNLWYTPGTAVGNLYAADANIRFHEGVAKSYPFGSTIATRVWNGNIHYVAAATPALTTTFAGGNGQNGNMFDVVALRNVAVHGFDLNLDPGTWNLEVYAVTGGGTCIGKEANASAWTLVGSAAGVVATAANVATPLPIAIDTLVRAGQTQGFYVTVTNGVAINYTDGTTLGAVYAQDDDLQILEGHGVAYPFAGTFTPRIWNGTLHYTSIPQNLSTVTPLGSACGYAFRSFYEEFANGNPWDLNGIALKWSFASNRYLVDNVAAAFVPPSASATPVAPGQLDGQQAFTLSAPMPVLGGSTTTLNVCTKGYVAAAVGNPIDFTPSGVDLLAFPQDTWACWMDYDQRPATSGRILYEEIGGIAYVTWNGVFTYSGQPLANTFQFQFRIATGDVTLVIVNLGGSSLQPVVVGFSPGGSSLNPGRTDISAAVAAGAIFTDPLDRSLALNAANTPTLGSTWVLGVSGIPATGVLGVEVLGLGDPGIDDLAAIGMPFCGLRSSLDVLTAWIVMSSVHSYGVPIPQDLQLMGFELFTTTAVFQVPPINAFGAITSRGLKAHVGNF